MFEAFITEDQKQKPGSWWYADKLSRMRGKNLDAHKVLKYGHAPFDHIANYLLIEESVTLEEAQARFPM